MGVTVPASQESAASGKQSEDLLCLQLSSHSGGLGPFSTVSLLLERTAADITHISLMARGYHYEHQLMLRVWYADAAANVTEHQAR